MSDGVKECQMVHKNVIWCQGVSDVRGCQVSGDVRCQGMSDGVRESQTLSSEISKYRKIKDGLCS